MRPSRLLRNRLLGATHRLRDRVAEWRAEHRPPVVALEQVSRRLELLLAAMYGEPWRVVSADAPVERTARDVVLPPLLDAPSGIDAAMERYRVLAVTQVARAMRAGDAIQPARSLDRDLFQMSEAAAVDREIVSRAPRLAEAIRQLRADELAKRPPVQRLGAIEREVEQLLQRYLASDPLADEVLATWSTAAESLAWAQRTAAELRTAAPAGARYRGLPPVGLWQGEARRSDELPVLGEMPSESAPHIEDPEGADGRADSESEPESSEMERSAAAGAEPAERGASHRSNHDDPFSPSEDENDPSSQPPQDDRGRPPGIPYPEWNARLRQLEPRRVVVRPSEAAERDDGWARAALIEHGPLARMVRDRFSLLRARRVRLRAQRAGDELDLDACVEAMVDVRLGRVPTERLYQVTRPTRHSLAILILVDVSGSTKTALADGRTVLDVERLSLLLASQALDALGDPYAILTFSSLGRDDVRVATVKDFAEHDEAAVMRRISSLEPEDNTRLGAAVRHASAMLRAQPAGRKVLLLISDGRPNDVDRYQGSDAIEDSRQALGDSRASGVYTFCLTVDAEEAEYLPHLFGAGGYRVLGDATQLPAALIGLVDRLLRG